MEDIKIQFLSGGQLHGTIQDRDDVMQQLRSDIHTLDEESVILKEKDLQYLSRGQLHDIIVNQGDLIQKLRSDIQALEEESVMSKGSFKLMSEDNLTLRDVMGESDITDKLFEQSRRRTQDILDKLGIEYTIVSHVVYTQGSLD